MTQAAPLVTPYGYCFRLGTTTPSRWNLQDAARGILPEERVSVCHRSLPRRKGIEAREVAVYAGSDEAWFSGLMMCGSVWHCPVCAAKISRHRAAEIQAGIDYQIARDGGVIMVTTTIRHAAGDRLDEMLERFAKALRRSKSGRKFAALREKYGIEGEIRALETTHGDNGWHPHTHSIWFTRRRLTSKEREQLKNEIFDLWLPACKREGLPDPTREHGVNVQSAKYAADYVAKFGFAYELSKAHMKKAAGAGRNPWQLLEDAAAGDKRAAWLFREYAQCFKGSRQLWWSKGLRDRLGIDAEMTEQEVMELEPEEPAVLIARIDAELWREVVKRHARGKLLQLARGKDGELKAYLQRLRAHLDATEPGSGSGGGWDGAVRSMPTAWDDSAQGQADPF